MDINDVPTVGQRILRFRKERTVSQQKLEVEADLSFGSISRFESDDTNPTRETLLRIGHVLGLTEREKMYLIGILVGPASQNEVDAACSYMKPYLERSTNPLHISDDTWRMNDWNKDMLDLIGLEDSFVRQFRGMNTLELVFNPNLPIRQNIPEQYWPKIADYQVTRFQREVNLWKQEKWYQTFILRLNAYPGFSKFWENAEKMDMSATESDERIFAMNNKEGKTRYFRVEDKRIDKYPRINLIEWVPIK